MGHREADMTGWYEDPATPGTYRFHDGTGWTDARLPRSEVPSGMIRDPTVDRGERWLLGLAGAAALLATSAWIYQVARIHDHWWAQHSVAFPCLVACIIGARALEHGNATRVRILGFVIGLAAVPGVVVNPMRLGITRFAIGCFLVIGLIEAAGVRVFGWNLLETSRGRGPDGTRGRCSLWQARGRLRGSSCCTPSFAQDATPAPRGKPAGPLTLPR